MVAGCKSEQAGAYTKVPRVEDAKMLNVVFSFVLPPNILCQMEFDWFYPTSLKSWLHPTSPQTNSNQPRHDIETGLGLYQYCHSSLHL